MQIQALGITNVYVALVYKIIKSNGEQFILKICERSNDYFREIYFLKYFANKLPVPNIIQIVEPSESVYGAILMEHIPGSVLKIKDFSSELAYEAGALLAQTHLNRVAEYGDLIKPNELKPNPIISFTEKFEEGLDECKNHLPKELIEQCKKYYNEYIEALALIADGPCIVHRDYRPGNIIAYNGKIQGIIDWSSARAGFAQEDFCSLEHTEWQMDSSSKKYFLEGYATIRSIPNYETIIPLLRLSKAVATIGFMVKRGTYASNTNLYALNLQFLENLLKNE